MLFGTLVKSLFVKHSMVDYPSELIQCHIHSSYLTKSLNNAKT